MLFLGEILVDGSNQIVVSHADCPVQGIESGESVNENAGVLIDVEDLERFLKEEVLDESRLVICIRFLEHSEKPGIFLCIEPHDIAVHGGVNLGFSPSAS